MMVKIKQTELLEDFDTIRKKIAWAQFFSDVSMIKIGEHIGINHTAVSQTLAGKYRMPAIFLVEICRILNIRVSWAVGESLAESDLELAVQEKIDLGIELTITMKRAKARKGKKINKEKNNTEISENGDTTSSFLFLTRSHNVLDRVPSLQKLVQAHLTENPQKSDKWIAEKCNVLPAFVTLERKSKRLLESAMKLRKSDGSNQNKNR